ncbi:hypothetical protein KY290_028995 [Solanum tuberosum]|uniref:Serine protease inhibitor, potato inhibitor I-type family protein n=2 Tax=Solanum tuberosum TaxID=4113 RepID=A0ABQ7UJI8_SOLTU|nr:hypothetical protein KY285_028035 [Solanum tuberosum]KAH0749763.1 hypothetical protein KY290_028995 [Solanum tuberosum]
MAAAKYPPCDVCWCRGNACRQPGDSTPFEWPELVGVKTMKAKAIVERSNPKVVGLPVDGGCSTTLDPFCCNRVWLCSDKNGLINVTPVVG